MKVNRCRFFHSIQFSADCQLIAHSFCYLQVAVVMVKTAVQAKQVNSIGMQVGMIAVDCEGCCLSRTGKLCLVQVSSHMACLSILDGGFYGQLCSNLSAFYMLMSRGQSVHNHDTWFAIRRYVMCMLTSVYGFQFSSFHAAPAI